jgi:hypothetical protein
MSFPPFARAMQNTSTAPSYTEFGETFVKLFQTLGWSKALTISLFFFFCLIIAYLMRSLIKGKDAEIQRLRLENDKYREIYLANLDYKHGALPPSKKTTPPKKSKP